MENLKTKSCLVYDYGTFESMAERLARDFGKVYYYTPWRSSYPFLKMKTYGIGMENVERIDNFWDYIDDVDLFVFNDIFDGDLQVQLESMGKKVWGSRRGEDMEMDRVGMKEYLKSIDLPVGHYEVVKGLTALRKYLKEHDNIWVKMNIFRGDGETFKSFNYRYIETRLNDLERNIGAVKEMVEFICEDDLPDKVEIGYDGYTINGQFPGSTLFGIEIKDAGYIGVFKKYDELPDVVKLTNSKLSSLLKNYRYKGFFSTEIRVGKDHKGYLIDPCARAGMPPNESYQEMFTNISDIIWEGAHGRCIDPIPAGKYAVELIIDCDYAIDNWVPVLYPEKYKNNIKFTNFTVIDGTRYQIPKRYYLPEIGAIVVVGNEIDGCIAKVKEIAESMKGFYIQTAIEALDEAKGEVEKLKSLGYDVY